MSQVTYTLQLSVVGSDGSILPLSVLDKHRLVSNVLQIGRQFWNEKWQDWSYEVLNVEEGVDVTGFVIGDNND